MTTFLAGHPYRIGAAAIGFAAAAVLAWYLGSPLFIRTYTNEALPAVSAAPSAAAAATAAATAAPATAAQPVARVVAAGELQFVDSIHNGMGPVQLVALGDQRFVRFDGVAITNAPDVHVYLAKETGGKWSEASSLYLGPLKATNGSFNYELPAGSGVADYRSVVVWCRQFRVLITWADLKAA